VYTIVSEGNVEFSEENSIVKTILDSEGCLLKKCCKAYKKKGKRCKKCP